MDGTYVPLRGMEISRNISGLCKAGKEKVVLVIVPRYLTRLIRARMNHHWAERYGEIHRSFSRRKYRVSFSNIFTGEGVNG